MQPNKNKIKEKLRDEDEIAATLHQLAIIYQAQGEMDTARELFEKSQRVFKKLGKSYTRSLHHRA